MKQDPHARIVFCTCPDKETAVKIAEVLVSTRLAACVNIINEVTSIYEWQGKLEKDKECQLIMKTTVSCLDDLEKTVNSMHPYELPELIAVSISDGSAGYLDWIQENTQ